MKIPKILSALMLVLLSQATGRPHRKRNVCGVCLCSVATALAIFVKACPALTSDSTQGFPFVCRASYSQKISPFLVKQFKTNHGCYFNLCSPLRILAEQFYLLPIKISQWKFMITAKAT